MAYLIVLALSVLAGGGVYVVTLRAGERDQPVAVGFDGGVAVPGTSATEPTAVDGPGPGYAYLRVETRGPSWRDRLQGFVGLLVLLAVGAAVLAFGIYQLGHLINLTIENFLAK